MKKTLPLFLNTIIKYCLILNLIFLSLFGSVVKGQDRMIQFTTVGTHTWTVPCGATDIKVYVWGAGGGGGGAQLNGSNDYRVGGGGGSGAFIWHNAVPNTPNLTYTIKVGAGGSGGQNGQNHGNGAGNGGNGENSFFNGGGFFLNVDGGGGGRRNPSGSFGERGYVLNTMPGSWSTIGGNGANGVPGSYGGGGGASPAPNFNGAENATGAAGAIAPLGVFVQANGGNGGNGQSGANGNGSDGSAPGGGGGGARRTDPPVSGNYAGGNGGNGKVIITYKGVPTYNCSISFGTVEPITLVNFAGINYTSSNTINGTPSLEKACQQGNVTRSNTYNITVKGNTNEIYFWGIPLTSTTNHFRAFIDWDQDGILGEAGEIHDIGTITQSNGIDTKQAVGSITVPGTAALGQTLMRVVKAYSASNAYPSSPCINYSYGQAEDYIINVTGSCQPPMGATANNVVTVLTVCSGTEVTLRQTGGAISSDQEWEWTKNNCTSGYENRNSNSDAAYTFTPLGAGTTDFFVKARDKDGFPGSCGTTGPCRTVKVIVVAMGAISANSGYSENFSVCKTVAPATNHAVFTITGGATNATATGLPAGLTGTYSGLPTKTFTISGVPTAPTGTYNYTINLSGNSPCVNPTITGTITITDKPTISYSGSPYTYCIGGAITDNVPTTTDGGLTTTYTVQGTPLPAGLSINASNGTISGTPSGASALTNYTIRATNGCGFTDAVIQIQVIAGNTIFNITPGTGSQTICSTSTGVNIGLDGSVNGINYQLYRDGTAVGTGVPGTGAAISMGTYNTAGIYTAVATTSCATNMAGSFTINVTPQPNATFAYTPSTICKSTTNPVPVISGTPTTGGTFTSTTGLIFANTGTGEIDLTLSPIGNNHTVYYNVPALGGCDAYTYGPVYINIVNAPDVYDVNGGGDYCSGGTGFPVGLNNSQSGITYELYRDGILVTSVVSGGGALSFGNQTLAGTYTVRAIMGTCDKWMDGFADITIKPSPSPITITPSTATLCQGTIIPLSASGIPPGTSAEQHFTLASGAINQAIPDNSTTGIFSLLKVTGIPAGATITRININFNITHTWDADLVINLKGPNNNVLSIANEAGSSGNNFTNTFVASNAVTNINSQAAPFTGTYAPNGATGVQGAAIVTGNLSNTNNFNGLYSGGSAGLNGNWYLSVRDDANNDVGTFNDWTINIYYTTVSNPVSVTWSPSSEIFLDAAGTAPYDNSVQNRVYAKPSASGTTNITATYTAVNGCTATATSVLTVNRSPVLTVTADYCSNPGKVRITATSDIPVTNWQWSGGYGAGTVSGPDSRYIEPNTAGTYYVSVVSTDNACPATGSMSVAQELVLNGDFEGGNTGFTTGYTYVPGYYSGVPTSGLWPASTYTVDANPQLYHTNFWGTDHTTANGNGKMMMVNGTNGPLVWSQTVTVLPNTVYYFSGYAASLNSVNPRADLQFQINGVPMPPPANTGVLPAKPHNNEPGIWIKFWGQWNSGAATTANIEIIDLVNDPNGNDFAIDDISFGTLSSFLNVISDPGTDNQQACVGSPIAQIKYEIGGDGSNPIVSGLPAGVSSYWNGRDLVISGSPTASGNFNYSISQQVCAGAFLNKTGTINVLPASESGTFAGSTLSACYNGSGTITVTGNVGTLTWQTSTDGITWANKVPNDNSYGSATGALYYRVIAQNTAACQKDTSLPVKLGIKNLWTGKTNDNWFTATNWSDDQVPNASVSPCPDVIIPDLQGTGKPYPIVSSGTAPVNNLVIHSRVTPGTSLTVLNNAKLQIAGSIGSPASYIDANDGTIEMNGGTQTISGSDFVGKNIEKLIVSGGLLNVSSAAGDTLNITEKLSFGTTSSDLYTGNNITIKSKLNRTASVGIINAGNDITGQFTIERIIQHYQNWNLVALPLRGSVNVRNSWQEGGVLPPTVQPGFGTRVTGPFNAPNPPANGLDNHSSQYSLKWWNPALNGGLGNWANVNDTYSENANRPQGFYLFVRGDRSYGPGAAGSMTTLRGKGNIYDGDNLPSLSITAPVNAFVSLANPYASAIRINKLVTANSSKMESNIWVWDPSLPGIYGLGGYQTISGPAGSIATPGGSSIYSVGNYPDIQSGQTVFIQTKSVNPTINFTESMKEDGSMQVQRTARRETMDNVDPDQVKMISTHLYTADGSMLDGNRVVFDDIYSDEVDFNDAEKLSNTYVNFGLLRSGKSISVEAKSSLKATDTLYYNLTGLPSGNFRIGVSVQNINAPSLNAELIDNYLRTRTAVSLTDSSFINFNTNNDAASKAANRFYMVFRGSQVVLPVTFVQVAAERNTDRSIDVQWKIANEINILRYEVERSADGRNFNGILTRDAASYTTYRQTDLSPLAEDNFYRIKAIGLAGDITYSNIVKVAPVKSPASIVVSPNPVKGKQMHVRFMQQPAGEYVLVLTNNGGQEIYRGSVTVTGSSLVKTVALHPSSAGGSYRLAVYDKKGERIWSELLMVE